MYHTTKVLQSEKKGFTDKNTNKNNISKEAYFDYNTSLGEIIYLIF